MDRFVAEQTEITRQLEAVTAELVATQDLYLTLLDMARELRPALTVQDALEAAAPAAARILHAAVTATVETGGDAPVVVGWPAAAPPRPQDDQPVLSAPIRRAAEMVGTLTAVGDRGRQFGSPERKIIHAIAEQVGVALESIVFHEERLAAAQVQTELRLAKTVQSHLLPPELLNIPGLQVAGGTLPARSVGGDFFNYTKLPSGQWQVCVGDVAGKGLPSALLMTMLTTTISNAGRFTNPGGPAALVKFINAALYDEMDRIGLFTTLFAAQHDPARRLLRYSNAGHYPVIQMPARGQPVVLAADDLPVGIFPDMAATERVVPIAAGDLVLIGTDGLTDARNVDGDMFGVDRLLAVLDEARGGRAETIRHTLCRAINEFSRGTTPADDQTLVILKGVDDHEPVTG